MLDERCLRRTPSGLETVRFEERLYLISSVQSVARSYCSAREGEKRHTLDLRVGIITLRRVVAARRKGKKQA